MMQHTNTVRRIFVALFVGGKEKYGKNYDFFKEKSS